MQYLKADTTATLKLGPFLDDGDGKTAETGLTIAQADVRLSKNGGDIAQKTEAASATHDELGYYNVAIDATDTNTEGRLLVAVSESGALPVWAEYMVVNANVYDSLFAAATTDYLQVDAGLDDADTELSSIPTTTGTLADKIRYVFQYFRNKKTVTSSTETLFKEDASTSLGTSTISADGTTFTRGEVS